MTSVHFVVPDWIDDPARPSGGNSYDRHLSNGLSSIGWSVYEHAVADLAALDRAVREIPDGEVVLIDGLVASPAPEVLVPHADRLRLVVLMHMPLADERERAVLSAAAAVVTTSEWGKRRLLELYSLPAEGVHVAPPGVDAAELTDGNGSGGSLLCVAAVTPLKGHDLLLDALATITDLTWRCTCVGSLDRDPAFAEGLRHRSLGGVHFTGPKVGAELEREYAAADVLLLPSRAETYGMVVTEALARGVPVIAADVGGVSEALGDGAGLLVRPDDPGALAAALRSWLEDAELRERLRQAARERRETLADWSATTAAVAEALR